MIKSVLTAFAAVAAVAAASSAMAISPVVVTDAVTGSAGAYTHTFTLTDNIGGANDLYFFGVDLSGTITGAPASWASSGNQNANWSNAPYGGSNTTYPNTWCCSFGGTQSGSSSTGFTVLSTVKSATIKFFAYADGGSDTVADGHFNNSFNPGFEGTVGGAVPEPAMWLMMVGGFGMVGVATRSRARRATLVA